jgi:hypothetical protein
MYTKPITQQNPSAIIFCLDCSTSMQELVEFNERVMSKASVVSMITNIMIDELIIRSSRHNRLRHYYDVAVIGYHGSSIENLLGGVDTGRDFLRCGILRKQIFFQNGFQQFLIQRDFLGGKHVGQF